MKKLIVGVAAALALTSPAVADGPYKRPPPTIAAPAYAPPPAPTWSGFYLGAGIGAGAVVSDVTADILGPGEPFTPFSFDGIGGEGVLGTVIVGWDWQIGASTVFGIFADFDFSDISTRFETLSVFPTSSHNHNSSWAIGARLGWLANPSTLWYLTAGYTEAQFDNFNSYPIFADDQRGDQTFSGYFVGAGLDTRLTGNWFLRLEYRYSQFDSETVFSGNASDSIVGVDSRIDVEPSMHTARLVLTYKLGGGYGWTMGR